MYKSMNWEEANRTLCPADYYDWVALGADRYRDREIKRHDEYISRRNQEERTRQEMIRHVELYGD